MRKASYCAVGLGLSALLITTVLPAQTQVTPPFHFTILGDRTGGATPGVFDQIWHDVAAEDPAFVLSVGDSIEGLRDASAESEWQQVEKVLAPYRRFPLYLTPGNHDIWSAFSRQLFEKHAQHATHYSFDYEQVHFTILDNSRSGAALSQ